MCDRKFPEYVPDEFDLRSLAIHYLDAHFDQKIFEFFYGTYSRSQTIFASNCFDRFERLTELLGANSRREIINSVEEKFQSELGDDWEVFKSRCNREFFSTPADLQVIIGRARELLKENRLTHPEGLCTDYLDSLQNALTSSEYDSSP